MRGTPSRASRARTASIRSEVFFDSSRSMAERVPISNSNSLTQPSVVATVLSGSRPASSKASTSGPPRSAATGEPVGLVGDHAVDLAGTDQLPQLAELRAAPTPVPVAGGGGRLEYEEHAHRGVGAVVSAEGAALPATTGEWWCRVIRWRRGHRATPPGARGRDRVADHRATRLAAVGPRRWRARSGRRELAAAVGRRSPS